MALTDVYTSTSIVYVLVEQHAVVNNSNTTTTVRTHTHC